jgi:hypothetical protein
MLSNGDLQEGTTMRIRIKSIISADTQSRLLWCLAVPAQRAVGRMGSMPVDDEDHSPRVREPRATAPKPYRATRRSAASTAKIRAGGAAVAVLAVLLVLTSTALAAEDFTWSGEGIAPETNWSNGGNWLGGIAPASSSTIGTLTFPPLTSSTCTANSSTHACYASNNDVSNLTVEHLQLVNQYSEPYNITGEGITLGGGGLSASPPTSEDHGNVNLMLPITLGAAQTWNLTGPAGGGVSAQGGNVTVEGLLGSGSELTVDLTDHSGLYLMGNNEVGNVTVNATNEAGGSLNLLDESASVELNATDGHTLTMDGGELTDFVTHAAIGAYSSIGSNTQVGAPYIGPAAILNAASAKFAASDFLSFTIVGTGDVAGSDYSQFTSTGPVMLEGASLALAETLRTGECPALSIGQQYTLISTTGALTGMFGNAPNGSTISDGACHNTYRINYNTASSPQTVTATVVTSEGSSSGSARVSLTPWFSSGYLGQGGSLTAEWSLEGSEYEGHVDPLKELTLQLPTGASLTQEGFETCAASVLEQRGPAACPAGSYAGERGTFSGLVSFGTEHVYEAGAVQPFFGPHGELLLFVSGYSPVAIELVARAIYEPATAQYGPGLKITVPPIETVPGAPNASIIGITLDLGATRTESGNLVHSVTLPACHVGEVLRWNSEATFENNSLVEAATGRPCPASSTTTLHASTTAPAPGETVTYSAIVRPAPFNTIAPYGLITFLADGHPIYGCEVPLETGVETATATCETTAEPGSHTITATFHGDPEYIGSTSEPAGSTTHEEAPQGGGSSTGGDSTATATTAATASVVTSPPGSTPAPILAQRQNASAISGTVMVRLKGTTKFVPLSGAGTIPDGSEVEVTNGRVLITVATLTPGKTQSAEVWGGRFLVHQERRGSGETHLTLSLSLTGCPRVSLPRGSAAAFTAGAKHSSGPKSRHLWVSEGGGSWGTNGRYVSTTVEGTHWLTVDQCNRSRVTVAAGKVRVHDLIHNTTKILTAGKTYVAAR